MAHADDRNRGPSPPVEEQSPLLSPQRLDGDDELFGDGEGGLRQSLEAQQLQWCEEDERSKSTWYLIILTLSIGGLQLSWTTELANGSPFLLSLGISKALLSFVWIAGPLTGVLVQPYIGILSDNSRSRWGKRRPFMAVWAVGTAISFFALSWSQDIVGGILGIFGADRESDSVKTVTIIYAVIWVYLLDFAINAVQAAIRAFIVDNAPTHQQEDANAWASRVTQCGSIVGFAAGYLDLPKTFPFLGNSQFKGLSAIAAVCIMLTVAISCSLIKERDARFEGPPPPGATPGLISFCKQTWDSMRRLPQPVRRICEVQFFNWMGWFPFLFYHTTYIGQLYVNPIFEKHPNLSEEEINHHWADGTRLGSYALLIYAILSLIASILLPFFVVPSYQPVFARDEREPSSLERILQRARIPHLTLRRMWMYSQILFGVCMLCTVFISTPTGGIILTSALAVPWAVSLWSPFALVSAEISKRNALRRARAARNAAAGVPAARVGAPAAYTPVAATDNDAEELGLDADASSLHLTSSNTSKRAEDEEQDQAGVVLGLHNVAISAPQIVSTLICSFIFKLTQRDRGSAGDESVAWVLRFGGVAGLAAAFWTWKRVKEEGGNK